MMVFCFAGQTYWAYTLRERPELWRNLSSSLTYAFIYLLHGFEAGNVGVKAALEVVSWIAKTTCGPDNVSRI